MGLACQVTGHKWRLAGMVVRWLRSTDEPLTGIFAAFDDMHRGPTEVMTCYLVDSAS